MNLEQEGNGVEMTPIRYEDEDPRRCPLAPHVEPLTASIKILIERTDTLISLNRDIIKWLLIVVCIIALGRSAFDVGKDLLKTEAAPHSHAIAP